MTALFYKQCFFCEFSFFVNIYSTVGAKTYQLNNIIKKKGFQILLKSSYIYNVPPGTHKEEALRP